MPGSESRSAVVLGLAEEFLKRCRCGERPSLQEYIDRFPELADEIRDVFPAMALMERIAIDNSSLSDDRTGPAPSPTPIPFGQLGDYRIIREVGRGGMGVVYEAEQLSLGRHVALKVLPGSGPLSPNYLERFQREARAAARLHHTNIVPVFGTGEADGTHFYAMQFIRGEGLDRVVKDLHRLRHRPEPLPPLSSANDTTISIARSLVGEVLAAAPATTEPVSEGATTRTGLSSTRAGSEFFRGVARLGVQVADALAYAHKQGILHRDIKPSNLVLDQQGTVWVTDFGLAKADGTDELTFLGDVVGTVRYMAPERFAGQSLPQSDIYSLGMTLYQVLALRPAFNAPNRPQLIEQILHAPVPALRKTDPQMPRDLETIVLKCLAKDPKDRYPTADLLADDLRRFLADRPIHARRATLLESLWRWRRRNPAVAGLTAAVIALLLIVTVGSIGVAIRLRSERDAARIAASERRDQLVEVLLARARLGRLSGQMGQSREGLSAVRQAWDLIADEPDAAHRLLVLRNEAIACLAVPDVRLHQSQVAQKSRDLGGYAFDSRLERYTYRDDQGNLAVCQLADNQVLARYPPPDGRYWFTFTRFSPDDRYLAVHSLGVPRQPSRWIVRDLESGQIIVDESTPGGAAFGAGGSLLAIAGVEDQVVIYNLPDGTPAARLGTGLTGDAIALSPDGKYLAVDNSKTFRLHLLDVATGDELASFPHPGRLYEADWSADGRWLAVACHDHRIYVYDTELKRLHTVLSGHEAPVSHVAFGPDGTILASTGQDNSTRLWDPIAGRHLLRIPGGGAAGLRFHASGGWLAITQPAGNSQAVVYELYHAKVCRTVHHIMGGGITRAGRDPGPFAVDFSLDGRMIATADSDGVRLFDRATARNLGYLPVGMGRTALFDPRGGGLLTYAETGVHFWPLTSDDSPRIGPPRRLAGPDSMWYRAAWTPRSGRIAITDGRNDRAVVLDTVDPTSPQFFPGVGSIASVAASPDGRWLAAGTWGHRREVTIWDAANGRLVKILRLFGTFLAFSPDSRWLVLSDDKDYHWFDTTTWEPGPRLAREGLTVARLAPLAFAPGSRLLALARTPAAVHLVDFATGEELAILMAPERSTFTWFCFSPDGSTLAAATQEHRFLLWDLRRLRQELAAMGMDWDRPAYPPAEPTSPVLNRITVDLGNLTVPGP